jgi:hypothetical protein
MDCKICGRPTVDSDDFCKYHKKSYENILEAFESWKIALDIDWENYLTHISEEEGAGKWVVEVVDYLMQQDGSSG